MIKLLLKVFCIFLFVSCTKKEPPSDEELKKIFVSNKEKFIYLKELCYQNEDFRSIDIDKKEILNHEGKKIFSVKNEKIFKTIIEKQLNPIFKSIECLRFFENDTSDVLAVRFVYHSVGIAVSGRLKAIEYKSDSQIIKFSVSGNVLKKIPGEKNWFIYDSEGH